MQAIVFFQTACVVLPAENRRSKELLLDYIVIFPYDYKRSFSVNQFTGFVLMLMMGFSIAFGFPIINKESCNTGFKIGCAVAPILAAIKVLDSFCIPTSIKELGQMSIFHSP